MPAASRLRDPFPPQDRPALRDRRRQQTALDLQRATLDLMAEHGLTGVTTGMIAARAGVSLRTFFNYYPNKEAAAVGHPPPFSEAAIRSFVTGTGTLSEDLAGMLGEQIASLATRHDLVERMFDQVRRHPELEIPLHQAILQQGAALTEIFRQRLPTIDADVAAILAEIFLAAVRHAIRLRLGLDKGQEEVGLDDIVQRTIARLHKVGLLLAPA